MAQINGWIAGLRGLTALGALMTGTGLLGLALHRPLAPLVLGGAAVGAAAAGAGWLACEVRRERVGDLIVGGAAFDGPTILAEVDRLTARSTADHLAATLERALHDGERWQELMPACRPPVGARDLPEMADDVRRIVAGLRAATVPPRTVVLLERLVRGGYGSAMYDAHRDWLRRELGRIRFELEAADSPSSSRGVRSEADRIR